MTKKPVQDETDAQLLAKVSDILGKGAEERTLAEWVKGLAQSNQGLLRQIRKQELDFTTVMEAANQINAKSLDSQGIESYIGYIVSTTRGQFGVSKVYVMRQADFGEPRIVLHSRRAASRPLLEFPADGKFAGKLRQLGAPFLMARRQKELADFEEAAVLRQLGVEVCVPLLRTDREALSELKGVLCLGKRFVGGYTDSELRFLGLLGNMIAISLHNAQLHYRSIVDSLTGVYSRGHFDMHLDSAIAQAERYGRHEMGDEVRYVTLVLMDVDHFKRFNDSYGHQLGDAVLQQAADAMMRTVRKSDVVARYGGEEFAVIAPEITKADGAALAERLKSRISECRVNTPSGGTVGITMSFGVATYPVDARTLRELVAKADKALYVAKERGRDCVVTFS
jgi:diguanylate cyclase (GGDEF)-like protein